MDDQDSIREWLKHVPDRLLNAEAGRKETATAAEYVGAAGQRLSVRALSVEKKWACANSENTIRNAKKRPEFLWKIFPAYA
jgi:hypothetical protein